MKEINNSDILAELYKIKALVGVLAHYDFIGETARKDIDKTALADLALEEVEKIISLLDQ